MRCARILSLCLTALILGTCTRVQAEDELSVTRLRVPSDQVMRWFPAGTELKGMKTSEFEKLVRDAETTLNRRAEARPPRLLKATHEARWQEGRLVGKSSFVIETNPARASALILAPWSPAVEASPETTGAVRSDADGHTLLWVPPNPSGVTTAKLDWTLEARSGTDGGSFALGLPGAPMSRLEVELPADMEPEGPAGLRVGPTPRPDARRALWVFHGPEPIRTLTLRRTGPNAPGPAVAGYVVEGETRIDLGAAGADWRLTWSVAGAHRTARPLLIQLDPALSFLDVSGPDVEEFHVEPPSTNADGTRVSVRLTPRAGQGSTQVTVHALTDVPTERAWRLPAARPLNALWTGGRTEVRLDAARTVVTVRTLASRRVAPAATLAGDDRRLVFDAQRPESVAEIVLNSTRAEIAAEVVGQLIVGRDAPRLSARVTWHVDRGRPRNLDLELPRSWFAERVEFEGLAEPASWSPETRSDGSVRVRVAAPSGELPENTVTLVLTATAAVAGGRGPLALPRVRPLDALISDEVWTARAEAGMTLRPTQARGLAWVADGLKTPDGGPPALAWRWNADDGEARIDRGWSEASARGQVDQVMAAAADRVLLRARVEVVAGEDPIRALRLGWDATRDDSRWRVVDAATGSLLSSAQAPRIDTHGIAWHEFVLSQPRIGRVVLMVSWETKWSEAGRVPLILLPDEWRPIGSVLLLSAPDVRAALKAAGARLLAPTILAESFPSELMAGFEKERGVTNVSYRPVQAFAYVGADTVCDLTTETLTPSGGGGFIREAVLTTSAAPGVAPPRHRLVLKIVPDRATSLEVQLPAGARLEDARRDGASIVPYAAGAMLSFPLGTSPDAGARPVVTLSLQYQGTRTRVDTGTTLRPERPQFSMPCLGLCWEIFTAEPWIVADFGDALTPTIPAIDRRRLSARLAGGRFPWNFSGLTNLIRPRGDTGMETLRDLNARIATVHFEAIGLGDWLTRLDAGQTPLIVDRPALARAGWGPRSQVTPPHPDPAKPLTAAQTFRALGLAVVPLGGAILVTTSEEAATAAFAHERDAWAALLAEAVIGGADESGRFQTVESWRAIATRAAIVQEPALPPEHGPSRLVQRFVCNGWPESKCDVILNDRRTQTATAWAVALGLITLGLFARGLPRSARALGVTACFGAGLLLSAQASPAWTGSANGLTAGAFALALSWTGAALPWPRAFTSRRGNRTGSTRSYRPSTATAGIVAPWLIIGAIGSLVASGTFCRAQSKTPTAAATILVLAPYDTPADSTRAPDRVLLRLSDFERLRVLADQAGDEPPATVYATDALHRIAWRGGDAVIVETEWSLAVVGQGAAGWRFPVQDAIATTATLDGVAVPIRIESGGKSAALTLDPGAAGKARRLVLRRVVKPRQTEGVWTIALPIHPVATAQVEVQAPPEGFAVALPGARGQVATPEGDDGPAGHLGPVDRLDVHWIPAVAKPAQAVSGTVDALALWDTALAGDRVRARLTYRNAGGTPVVRILLDASAVVREAVLPGFADVSLMSTARGREWVARFDPPLAEGATIALDVWRPAISTDAERARPAGLAVASMPRIEPLGVERVTTSSAFRRPVDWTGRMATEEEDEVLTEESFVRLWGGTLPTEPLTLSGALRQVSTPGRWHAPQVETGFVTPRLRVQPRVQLNVGAGRVDLTAEAKWSESGEPAYEVDVALPAGIRIDRVTGTGLTSWEIDSTPILRLRFDGPAAPARTVRFHGWMPLLHNPLEAAPPTQELAAFWPRWRNQEELPGTLSVIAKTRVQLFGPAGAALPGTSEAPNGSSTPNAPMRVSYRVENPDAPGTLRWEVEPARVAVFVRSQWKLDPETAEWSAVLRYVVSGGPLAEINLRLPTEWANAASVRLDDVGHHRTVEVQGENTFWTLRPERPIWGSQRVVVRSSVPFPAGESRAFPELKPRGRGESDTLLRLVNATRAPIRKEAQGVREVSAQSFPAEAELDATNPKAAASTTYHVEQSDWSLRVTRPGPTGEDRADHNATRPLRAEIDCGLAADDSLWGVARYRLATPSGPFLPVDLPAGLIPVWAAVDARPIVPLRSHSGTMLIPLGTEPVAEVSLAWRSVHSERSAARGISMPKMGTLAFPTLVRLHASTGMLIAGREAGLVSARPESIALQEANFLATETMSRLPGFDRGARRDAENLVADLVRIELRFRQAIRSAAWEGTEPSTAREERVRGVRAAVEAERKLLADAFRAEGLMELWESARVQTGLAASKSGKTATQATPEAVAPARVNPVGRAFQFLGETSGGADLLAWTPAPSVDAEPSRTRMLLLGILVATLGAGLVARDERILKRARPAALLLGLTAAGLWAGPVWVAVGIVCAIGGRLARAA